MSRFTFLIISFLIYLALPLWGQNRHFLEIDHLELGDLRMAGFSLNEPHAIHIKAEGAGEESRSSHKTNMMQDPNNMFAYAWIINANTRDLVWKMTPDNTKRDRRSRYNRKFDNDLSLPAGDYEVYYSARKPGWGIFDDGFFSLGRLLDKLLGDKDWYERDVEKWFFRLEGADRVLDENSLLKYHKARKQQAVVSITNLHDSDFRQEGFRLTRPGEFQIYAVGEAYQDEAFDYGWIIRADNSEKVWESLPEKGEYAGGSLKNRRWKDTIRLAPGEYWVFFVMDDSNSPGNWNANPPYDPDYYGITVTGVPGKFDPQSIQKIVHIKVKPIVQLTRLGDDVSVEEGFKLTQPMKVRVYAVGEGRGGRMFDYGWIVRMDTGEKVWSMDYDRTRHAGGARKNRLVDEVIELPAGSYMVYFVTDDSHSYPDWNSAPPYNPTSWGITIYPADPKFSEARIQKLKDQLTSPNLIAQIVRVRDGEHLQRRFELKQPTRIRIYAIGEGDWDEMYDYGWIEREDTGEKVWQMEYDQTRWAGGARKNRKVDTHITLPAGRYILNFRTDDSHSFNDWNDDPPDDPLHYGITLYKEGGNVK